MLASQSVLSAFYRRAASSALGEGLASAFASLDVSDADFARLGKLGAGPGERGTDPYHGITMRIVRVRGAAISTAGLAVKRYLGGANRAFTLTAGSTAAILTSAQTYADNEIGGAHIRTTGGTGLNQFRTVLEFDAAANATMTVAKRDYAHDVAAISTADALSVVPDNTTTVEIYAPWEVTVATGVNDFVSGISLGAVTQDNWTIIVEKGPVPHKVNGSTDNTTSTNPMIVPSSATGIGKGMTGAGITAAEAVRVYALALDSVTFSSVAALRLVDLLGRFSQ